MSYVSIKSENIYKDFPGSPVFKTTFPLQKVQSRSLNSETKLPHKNSVAKKPIFVVVYFKLKTEGKKKAYNLMVYIFFSISLKLRKIEIN